MQELTREQAVAVTALTGITFCRAKVFIEDVSKKLGRIVHPSEFNNPAFLLEVKERYEEDFVPLCYDEREHEEPKSKLILPNE